MHAEPHATVRHAEREPLLEAHGNVRETTLQLGGRVYTVRGIPGSWLPRVPSRLLRCRAPAGAAPHRVVDIELSHREDLRAPDEPHDLNETSRLLASDREITYRSDWCEGRFAHEEHGPVTLLCHAEGGPWFGGTIDNMLRVLVAYDAVQGGAVMLHCAAVVRRQRAVILFGHSGAGKSTSSALALEHGCSVVSDDINLLARDGDRWNVVPLPFCGTLGYRPEIAGPIPVAGIFHLNKSDVDRSEACSPARAVSLLGGSAPFVNRDPSSADRLMDVLARLAADVPVNELHFTPTAAFLDIVFGGAA